jgi:hypothetical protein
VEWSRRRSVKSLLECPRAAPWINTFNVRPWGSGVWWPPRRRLDFISSGLLRVVLLLLLDPSFLHHNSSFTPYNNMKEGQQVKYECRVRRKRGDQGLLLDGGEAVGHSGEQSNSIVRECRHRVVGFCAYRQQTNFSSSRFPSAGDVLWKRSILLA